MRLEILETDNRDDHCTTLTLAGPGGSAWHTVDVDPTGLFVNMLENLISETGEPAEDYDTSELEGVMEMLHSIIYSQTKE